MARQPGRAGRTEHAEKKREEMWEQKNGGEARGREDRGGVPTPWLRSHALHPLGVPNAKACLGSLPWEVWTEATSALLV